MKHVTEVHRKIFKKIMAVKLKRVIVIVGILIKENAVIIIGSFNKNT